MARRQTVGRRYAEAAFEIGRSDGTLPRWSADLARIRTALEDPDLRRLAEHPAVPARDKERVLRRHLGGSISPEAMNLLLLLVRRGRIGGIGAMADHFEALVRRAEGVVLAEVRTALPLDDAQREAVRARVESLTGGRAEVRDVVDEALIGGIAVRIGDQLYDASVRSRLERLRARLTAV